METEYYYFIKGQYDGKVADVENESRDAGAPLIAAKQKERTTVAPDNQLWEFVLSDTPPYFFIASKQTGQVMDVQDEEEEGRPRLIAYPQKDSKTENQRWMLVPSDETEQYFFITTKLREDLVITNIPDPCDDPKKDPKEVRRVLVLAPRGTPAKPDQLWSLVRFR